MSLQEVDHPVLGFRSYRAVLLGPLPPSPQSTQMSERRHLRNCDPQASLSCHSELTLLNYEGNVPFLSQSLPAMGEEGKEAVRTTSRVTQGLRMFPLMQTPSLSVSICL